MTSNDEIPELERGGNPDNLCDTPTMATLTETFLLCQQGREFALITGEPGVGKTSAARRFVAQNIGAHLVTMSPASNALVPTLVCIGEAINVETYGAGASAWSGAIRKEFNHARDPQVLLIDEAQHMSDASIEEVRAIFDAARVGIVLIGGPGLRDRFLEKRWAQLTSRMLLRLHLDRPRAADIDAICTATGITGKPALALLRDAARRPGALRLVRKIADAAAGFAGTGSAVTAEHIERALIVRGEKRS